MSFDLKKLNGSPEDKDKTKKYPVIWPEYKRLIARREEIMAASQKLEDERKPIIEQIAKLHEKDMAIVARIEEIQQPLYDEDIDNQLSALAAAMLGVRLNG